MGKIMGYLNARDFGACGSAFETKGTVVAGSNRIKVENIGDFAVGQELKMFGATPRCKEMRLWGPVAFHGQERPVQGEVELRGWDASNGDHVAYLIDVDHENPTVFKWTDDLGRTWHENEPLNGDWHPLSGGLEVKFCDFDWNQGCVISILMKASMITEIIEIDGDELVVDQVATRSCTDRVIHSDTKAMQKAIDTALAEGADLWIPEGTYRMSGSLFITDARSLTIRGASPERTILDVGVDGVCLILQDGKEVNIYDLGFRGGIGFDRRDQAGHRFDTKGASGVWGFYFMQCSAMSIRNTERVYVENCHARKMSTECFYSHSVPRTADEEPACYTKSISYVRCSVEDCARNAFNNNDRAENTHMIDCRIRDVGGCTWEGASRYVQMRGCYIRNAGCIGMGNVRDRSEINERLGTGQHVIVDNTFESGCPYGLAQMSVGACAAQVIIKGNNFINFNSNGIIVSGNTGPKDLPSRNVIITGNTFDMTAEETPSVPRTAITVTTSDVTISDNQIFSTIKDENVTAIQLRNDAQGIIVHDNLVRGCGEFMKHTIADGVVGEVIDDTHFCRYTHPFESSNPTLLRRRSHHYRGWILCWENGEESVMEDFDAETCIFTIKEPRKMKTGDRFTLKPRYADGRIMDDRLIHDNMVL